jgi:transcriptional regulator with PAS, ATPase and Fis domain
MKVGLSQTGLNSLLNYSWRGNIREIENLVNNVYISGKELNDDCINSLQKDSEELFQSLRDSEVSLAKLEQDYINYLLKKYKNKAKVAKILQISRKSLYNKLKKYAGN